MRFAGVVKNQWVGVSPQASHTQPINTNFVIKSTLYSTVQSGEATFEEVKNVADNKSKNVLLIDVREPEELRETGVIPGSINIPLGHVKCALRDMSNEEFSRKYGIKKTRSEPAYYILL
ncbi:hypothetical protein NQ318_010926 [Aromia moschata]|uniref:Rhodanese domain-containing protein n=1 Tax=Aromia moschata TaxID=1265417 RepID=A0AAV8XES1_9CUCU|nr:hypothetical protein NQ318_010926 [Aromia moschata]